MNKIYLRFYKLLTPSIRVFIHANCALLLCLALPAIATEHAGFVDPELRALLKKSVAEADSFKDRFDAEVWLVAKSEPLSRYVKDPQERLTLLRLIHREASRAKLQPSLVLAVIQIESAFDQFAISSAGALGLMQVMPFWKKEIGRVEDNLMNTEVNLRYGCTILKLSLIHI